MTMRIVRCVAAVAALLVLAGCATRPVNPPLAQADHAKGYRFETRARYERDRENLIVLAFSGGGTRAAAFSYGVLEALRDIELVARDGKRYRAIDAIDLIAGVSGGSFTALAFGLRGDRLFDDFEKQFLKRDVEGELMFRVASPANWGALSSTGWGRSELAADFYDEILFHGATFGDLERGRGPMIVAAGTDVNSGARFYFTQAMFDILCSDLSAVRLSRAAATSSAVPVIFSPVTYNNYGGTCGYREPPWLSVIANPEHPVRPAARSIRYFNDLRAYEDGKARPYIHVVDGGVGDNLGMRGILDVMDVTEAMRLVGLPSTLDNVKRMAIVVVNSVSLPTNDLDRQEAGPGIFYQFMQSTAVPIDHYSFESVEMLRDTAARWKSLRAIRDSGAIADWSSPALLEVKRVPDTEIYVVDISFDQLDDANEKAFLNQLPTSFRLADGEVDRLRAAGRGLILKSPEFRRFLVDAGARIAVPGGSGAAVKAQ
jgi:NTE family protein